jgi:hypothetical protein
MPTAHFATATNSIESGARRMAVLNNGGGSAVASGCAAQPVAQQ